MSARPESDDGDSASRRRPVTSGLVTPFACGVLVLTAVALWLVWPAFGRGHIVNYDAPRHLLRSVVMATQLLPAGHVDGWSPWWYLGAQLFLFQSYAYFVLIGASALLLAGIGHLATLEQVFKCYYVLPIVVLPAVTAHLALRLGVARRGALAAALASLVFSSALGYGVLGVFGIGLLLQGAGIVGFALAWPEMLAVLLERERAPWRAVLVVAAVLLCHFITGAFTLAAAGLVAAGVALRSRDCRPLLRYALVAALVLLIAAHALLPSLELRELAGPRVGWGTSQGGLSDFLDGTMFGPQAPALAAMIAAAWSIFRGGSALSISAIVFFATALAGSIREQSWEPDALQALLQVMVRPRALPYAGLFEAVFAGVAFDGAMRGIEAIAAAIGRVSWARAATPAALAALLLLARPELAGQRRHVTTASTMKTPERRVYLHLVRWLRANVTPPSILAVPRLLFRERTVGPRSVISLLNLDTGLYTLGGDQSELSRVTRREQRVDLDHVDEGAEHNAELLREAGVSHLIVSRPRVRRALAGNPDFELVFEYQARDRPHQRAHRTRKDEPLPGVAVYRLRDGGVWLHGQGLEVLEMQHDAERISWRVRAGPDPGLRVVTAAVNWHPNWVAWVDGQRAETRCSRARRVSFDVPAGAARVTLAFERTTREKAANLVSAMTLLLVLAAWRRDERTRRRGEHRPPISASHLVDGES